MPKDRGAPPEAGAGGAASASGPGPEGWREAALAEDPAPLTRQPAPLTRQPAPLTRQVDVGPGDPGQAGPDGTHRVEAAPGDAGQARPGQMRRGDPVPWLIALATFMAYLTISIFRYMRLDPGSWDLGIYTEYVRQLARLHAPVVTIRGSGFNLLGDHFQPIVALIAPFYRLFPGPVTLLVAQALLTAVSVIPVCRAAQPWLGTGTSRLIGAAYGFSWGLQQMIIFDFHEIAFAVPLLACSLSALVRGRPRAAALWALPLVFVKEDQGLTVAAIGLLMVAAGTRARAGTGLAARGDGAGPGAGRENAGPGANRDSAGAGEGGTRPGASTWAWAGGLLVVWGIAWSVLAIAVIIPHFNPAHQYPYWHDGGVLGPGGGHVSAGAVLSQFTHAGPEKLRTLALVLLPVAFLALRSPLAAVAVPGLALRFLSTNSNFWGTDWHYSATVMPVVFLAAVDALIRLRARYPRSAPSAQSDQPGRSRQPARPAGTGTRAGRVYRPLHPGRLAARYGASVMLVIAVFLASRFPLAGLWAPKTYLISAHVQAEDAAMARVPAGTTVESTLTMLAPLAVRDTTYWIGTSGNPAPRYIVFDGSNSGYSPAPTDIPAFVAEHHRGVLYRKIFELNDVYVFRRDGRTHG
jgi:uncharacterized membrane protein